MIRVLHCDCGFTARADDEERLVAEIRRHAREAHGTALSHDDALLLAIRADVDASTRSTIAPKSTTRADNEKR